MKNKSKTQLKHLEIEAEEIAKNIAWLRGEIHNALPYSPYLKKLSNQLVAQSKRYYSILEKAKVYGKDYYWEVEVVIIGIDTVLITYPSYVLEDELENLVKRDIKGKHVINGWRTVHHAEAQI